jgi:hypothetical protein
VSHYRVICGFCFLLEDFPDWPDAPPLVNEPPDYAHLPDTIPVQLPPSEDSGDSLSEEDQDGKSWSELFLPAGGWASLLSSKESDEPSPPVAAAKPDDDNFFFFFFFR